MTSVPMPMVVTPSGIVSTISSFEVSVAPPMPASVSWIETPSSPSTFGALT